MSFGYRLLFALCAVWLVTALSGCAPPGQSQADEEKEPHFVLGKSRVNAMDYKGAIEAFQESLEANPRSAAAHFELGWLYDEKVPNPAAAIYHYQEYLKLCPNAGNAEVIRQRIYSCKQQLAADVMPLANTSALQKQVNQLMEKNQQLQDEVNKWRAYYASQLAAARTKASPLPDKISVQPSAIRSAQNPKPASLNTGRSENVPSARPRTYTVVAGDTAVGISRKYGIKLSTLEAANPNMNPSRIQVGQILNIPSP